MKARYECTTKPDAKVGDPTNVTVEADTEDSVSSIIVQAQCRLMQLCRSGKVCDVVAELRTARAKKEKPCPDHSIAEVNTEIGSPPIATDVQRTHAKTTTTELAAATSQTPLPSPTLVTEPSATTSQSV